MKKVLIKDSTYAHLNGEIANVLHEDINENKDKIFCLDIPHPEDNSTLLWVNELDVEILN